MTSTVLKSFQEMVKEQEDKNTGDPKILEANEAYNKLIKMGVIKKRGYTLLTIQDRPVPLKYNT